MNKQILDLTGRKFGRLTVISYSHSEHKHLAHWNCQCECGNKMSVRGRSLISGNTKSCGCFRRENSTKLTFKHGRRYNDLTYSSWRSMRRRCCDVKHKYFNNYGGRGITICDRWINDFNAFLQDMGERPKGYTLDRINNEGNYEPINCKWSDRKTQASNRRKRSPSQISSTIRL